MSINADELVVKKIDSILKGKIVSKLEVFDKDMIAELVDKYGNEERINYEDVKVYLTEYNDGIKNLVLNGQVKDEGLNYMDCEEHIVIKSDTNVVSYSRSNTLVSYLQLVNPYLNSTSMIAGRDILNRERFNLYIGRKKKMSLETYREKGLDKVIYERYIGYADITKRIDLYYNALEVPIYGEMFDSSSEDKVRSNKDVFVKEMMELASQEVVDGVEGKIERESILVKK